MLNIQQIENVSQEPDVVTEPEIVEISLNSSARPAPGLSVPQIGKGLVVSISNVNSFFSKTRQPIVEIKIHNVRLQVLIYTCLVPCCLNVLDKGTFEKLCRKDDSDETLP